MKKIAFHPGGQQHFLVDSPEPVTPAAPQEKPLPSPCPACDATFGSKAMLRAHMELAPLHDRRRVNRGRRS